MPKFLFVSLLRKAFALLRLWRSRHQQRRALADRAQRVYLLTDIGLTQDEALREAAKPFWRK